MTLPSDADPKQRKTAAGPPGTQCPLPHSPDCRASDIPDLLEAARALHEDAVRSERAASARSPCTKATAREHPAISCIVVTGNILAVPTDVRAVMDLVEVPRRENGWRSRTNLRTRGGSRVSVEIITGFGSAEGPVGDGSASHRVRALQSIGAADRRLAETTGNRPVSWRSPAQDLIDVRGCVDLLRLSTLLDEVEINRLPEKTPHPVRRVRRMHGFPSLALVGPCELVVEAWLGAEIRLSTASIRSHLRRASTNEILAVSESLYRP